MWVTKLMISQVKKRILCPKTTKFGPKLAFLVDMGQAMQVFSVPCWLVGWRLWRAGCISQDTYLLYSSINHIPSFFSISTEAPLPRYHGKVDTWCSGSVMNSCREFVTTIREANVNAKGRAILLKSKHLVNIKNGFVHGVSHPKMKKIPQH